MESPHYRGETTGLALSPDGRFMYVAYQDVGKLFCLWRLDGKAFGAERLDVKYHNA
jgi:sugar lactone lactonase YvrE